MAAAGRELGVTRQTVLHHVQKPIVQSLLRQALATAGITDELLAKRMREGIDATEDLYLKIGKKIKTIRAVVDMEQRRKYSELALKVRGDLATKEDGAAPPTPLFGDLNIVAVGELDFVKILKQYTAGVSSQRS